MVSQTQDCVCAGPILTVCVCASILMIHVPKKTIISSQKKRLKHHLKPISSWELEKLVPVRGTTLRFGVSCYF